MNSTKLPKYINPDTLSDQAFDLADRADYIDAMSRVANSVNVVTTNGAGGQLGVTVSAATSVTAEPPTLLVCIHELSKVVPAITENGVFCLNVLESEQQAFSQLFAGLATEEPAERFSDEHWTQLKTGSPVLKNGLAIFDCRVD
ncbi:MAG: flavin reductase family protein, partial [Pseudomonadales bacterium]